jgi:hypothetical protein
LSKLVLSGDTSGSVTLDAPAVSGTTTLTLPTTSGTLVVTSGAQTIEFADGSASTPSITNSGDTNTGMFFPAADTIAFAEGGTEAMRLDASGRVGIGTTSPSYLLNVSANGGGGDSAQLVRFTDTSTANSIGPLHLTIGTANHFAVSPSPVLCGTNGIAFGVGDGSDLATQRRMTIDSSGNVLVGTTNSVASTRMSVERIGGAGNEATIGFTASGVAKWKIGNNAPDSFVVYTPSNVGVYINSGATSWTATSDERLKNITGNIENALDAVQTLRAVKFTWIADEENKSQVGLIAQDVQTVLPEVISEDAEGYLGIRYTETIPLLVAAIQEQQTIIETLKADIAALKAKVGE